jgi:SAM-dependent methyltransferase
MTQKTDHDYVLGTHDAEIARLAFQHAIWTDEVQHAWRTAGIGAGARVMDVGAGPGFASVDLARIVGPTGRVFAVERSQRFLDVLANAATAAGHHWIEPVRADLMEGPLPVTDLDAAWCRWVACFVPDVAKLIAAIAAALKPGGRLVLHEYHAYSTYGLLPNRPEIRSFVDAVYESWRAQGGEPDIATRLPKLLVGHGFDIVSARPLGFAARPQDRRWNWPAGFVRTNVPRLVELGVRDQSWANQVLQALEEAEQDPASIFITPTVLELIAVRRDAVSKP